MSAAFVRGHKTASTISYPTKQITIGLLGEIKMGLTVILLYCKIRSKVGKE
jgi:hypothetical protein